MALQFLLDLLTGNMALVNIPGTTPPPSGGTALFVDGTGINFVDGTNMNWVT